MNEFSAFLDQVWLARFVLLRGLGLTVSISLLAIALGSVLGVLVGLALTYGNRPLRFVVRAYTDFIRGTPVLVLVLASFYILSTIGIELNAFQAGVFALAVFCSSHVGEIVRGALQAIPPGQTEAAKAIGLTFSQTFTSVLWPQALRQMLPTWVNTAAEMVKASTLLSVIGVAELLLRTQEIISRNFMSLEFYFLAGLLYFAINYAVERFGKYVERKVSVPS
ncbi:amino acid ABC transporter permease [Nitratireductor sp. L1-7-SE]|uniref:Amino acid ABC transporter permease n=1 Tax=Nitratireductor rhodophyticola TaxID=2854036 RepID=A0ABS7RAD9_9HYPH|nr:amino acid ABC transporter permease [Nitratireductor rhodophyticola]MBY8917878.1 amino acid ABC transporter permease [Nitratireductor rhodophyticola]MBY8922589.1 amino acid ABC transporter permease [Nitratireductor rhodophyticola]